MEIGFVLHFMRKHRGVGPETRYASLSLSCGFKGSFPIFSRGKRNISSTSTWTLAGSSELEGKLLGGEIPGVAGAISDFDTS